MTGERRSDVSTLEEIIRIPEENARQAALTNYYRQEDAERTRRLVDLTEESLSTHQYIHVQSCISHIPPYEGRTPLRDFVQDVENVRSLIPLDSERIFLRGVISKLRGKARDALEGQTVNDIDTLIKILKSQFAPSKSYLQYMTEIVLSTMKQGENVRSYHGRLTSLIRGAKAALRDAQDPNDDEPVEEKHLQVAALQAFLKGVHESWRATLANTAPRTFEEALESAVNIERYQGYAESDTTGLYHIYHHGIPNPSINAEKDTPRVYHIYHRGPTVKASMTSEHNSNTRCVSYNNKSDISDNYNWGRTGATTKVTFPEISKFISYPLPESPSPTDLLTSEMENISCIQDVRKPPSIKVAASQLKQQPGEFILDTAAGINIIKVEPLNPRTLINIENRITIEGICTRPITTLGTTIINILGKDHTFHVLKGDTTINEDGILGTPFLEEEQVRIDFASKTAVLMRQPVTTLPFVRNNEKQKEPQVNEDLWKELPIVDETLSEEMKNNTVVTTKEVIVSAKKSEEDKSNRSHANITNLKNEVSEKIAVIDESPTRKGYRTTIATVPLINKAVTTNNKRKFCKNQPDQLQENTFGKRNLVRIIDEQRMLQLLDEKTRMFPKILPQLVVQHHPNQERRKKKQEELYIK